MRYLHRALLAGGLGFAVSCLAACGGGAGLLSGDQASTLNNQLTRISSALAAGDCSAVQSASDGLARAVANLPTSVNGTLRQDLDQGASTVGQLAVQQCHSATTQTSPTTSTAATSPTTTGSNPGTTGGGGLSGGSGASNGSGGANGNGQ